MTWGGNKSIGVREVRSREHTDSTHRRGLQEICRKSSLRVRRASGRHDSPVSPSITLADNSFLSRAQEELRFQQHQ